MIYLGKGDVCPLEQQGIGIMLTFGGPWSKSKLKISCLWRLVMRIGAMMGYFGATTGATLEFTT